jgi:hypothetical protein
LSFRIQHGLRVAIEERRKPVKFLTLTLDPSRNRASAANGSKLQAKYASACWRRLTSMWRERCRRQEIAAPWYVRIAEWRDRTDALHYHVLLVGWLPGRLADDVVAAGFGMVHDVQRVRAPEAAARYLTSYVTKAARARAPRYVNRYSSSKDALPPLPVWIKARRMWPGAMRARAGTVASVPTSSRWWRTSRVLDALEREEEHQRELGARPPKGTKFHFLGSARPPEER